MLQPLTNIFLNSDLSFHDSNQLRGWQSPQAVLPPNAPGALVAAGLSGSCTLIAYDFYKKLGYKDPDWVNHISSAYKLCKGAGFKDEKNKKSLD